MLNQHGGMATGSSPAKMYTGRGAEGAAKRLLTTSLANCRIYGRDTYVPKDLLIACTCVWQELQLQDLLPDGIKAEPS